MRHVASKTSHIGADGEEPSKEVAEEHEEKTKRNRRAKKDGNDEDGTIAEDGVTSASNEEERLEQLYEKIAWPLGKQYGHPYDAFKLALTCVLYASVISSCLTEKPTLLMHQTASQMPSSLSFPTPFPLPLSTSSCPPSPVA